MARRSRARAARGAGPHGEPPAMIRPSGDVRIHLHRQPVDMRKAINGLVSIVEGEMGRDPFSADLYIFCNRARTLVKMVAWEGNGFVLWMKRLEKSRFKWPLSGSDSVLKLTVQEINWLLDGYPLTVTQANGSLLHHRVL
ncbi:IS66 family insertion sequence element accessory protein TnpB [Lentisalinibacter orientalis]|uniref:IS66 family insertion sequence element accessory protein TnpB n=1 Tax=Lentisalinibacter orientalis TaxID=2992241 RepID=UPI0038695EB5